jgi:hypothetical protein
MPCPSCYINAASKTINLFPIHKPPHPYTSIPHNCLIHIIILPGFFTSPPSQLFPKYLTFTSYPYNTYTIILLPHLPIICKYTTINPHTHLFPSSPLSPPPSPLLGLSSPFHPFPLTQTPIHCLTTIHTRCMIENWANPLRLHCPDISIVALTGYGYSGMKSSA